MIYIELVLSNYTRYVTTDGSDYEASEEDASASQEDVSDYEGMPADVQDREVYQFSPEDQRRMRFRR